MDSQKEDEETNWLSFMCPADKPPSPAPSSSKLQHAKIDENTTKTNSCHSEVDSSEKMKTKLMSMWNNVKYGWTVKVKTNFSYESPIWLLGKCYHKKLQGQYNSDFAAKTSSIELFKQDFSSRIWFTYRREFPTLAGSNLTTDCGWGCMLRSGQMLLAQALVCHFLGRDWRWNSFQTPINDVYHRMIIKWFADHPCSSSPFSVHKLVSLGENSGKKAGEWYGPASVAYILKQAVEIAAKKIPLLDSICVYVAQDCTIYQQDVFDLCTAVQRKRSFCGNSLSDKKQNSSSKNSCCDDKNITETNTTSSYLKNSSIKFNDINHSNIDYKTREEIWEPQKFNSFHENSQKMYEKVADNCFINPHLFNENSKEICSTSNNYNHLKMNQKEDHHNTQTKTSIVYDFAKNAVSKENFSTVTNSSVFCNSVNSLTAYKNIRSKENGYGERKSFLLRSASVPPSSSEEINYLSTNEDTGNEYNSELKDFLCINDCNNSSEQCLRWKSVIILVPVRLGGEILNHTYIPRVRDVLTQEHCIGIIGGRPRHSLYFIGWQDDKLIYLDPHYCQEVVDICTTDFPLQVTTRTLQQWAMAAAFPFLSNDFTFYASRSWVNRFKCKYRIKQWNITKFVSIKDYTTLEETMAAAEKFRIQTRMIFPDFEMDLIINTDQTGCQYEMAYNRTLADQGTKTVVVRKKNLNALTFIYSTICLDCIRENYPLRFPVSAGTNRKIRSFGSKECR